MTTYCAGVHSNEHWLAGILRPPRFLEVRHNIALLDQRAATPAATAPAASLILAALAALAGEVASGQPCSPWEATDGFTPNLAAEVSVRLVRLGETHTVRLIFRQARAHAASIDGGAEQLLHETQVSAHAGSVRLGAQRFAARLLRLSALVHVWSEDAHYEFRIDDPRAREFQASAASGGLTTPLPGVVVSVPVKLGDEVSAGTTLMVIEAMKMEHAIIAPYAGTVSAIHFAPGERVPEGSALLGLERAG